MSAGLFHVLAGKQMRISQHHIDHRIQLILRHEIDLIPEMEFTSESAAEAVLVTVRPAEYQESLGVSR